MAMDAFYYRLANDRRQRVPTIVNGEFRLVETAEEMASRVEDVYAEQARVNAERWARKRST